MTKLDAALQQFEATEANLARLNSLWGRIQTLLSDGPAFGSPPEYDELLLAFRRILPSLPAIEGFRVEDHSYEYDAVGQMRVDALELGGIEAELATHSALTEQGRQLREYGFRLQSARRQLVRDRILSLMDEIDELLSELWPESAGLGPRTIIRARPWGRLEEAVAEIDTLLGAVPRPPRWGALKRHLSFGMVQDLSDIREVDWPAVSQSIRAQLYGEYDAIPVAAEDLGDVVAARPAGAVATRLDWSVLTDENFERLLFSLISDVPGYENPQWLQKTHAPDRGRDSSVDRVEEDPLAGVRRYRIIIQCKRWLSKSVSVGDISEAKDQMALWAPPRVDELVIATTGRFTADAILLVERHNQRDSALRIAMWPESHLERLLATRPHLIGEFRLRGRA